MDSNDRNYYNDQSYNINPAYGYDHKSSNVENDIVPSDDVNSYINDRDEQSFRTKKKEHLDLRHATPKNDRETNRKNTPICNNLYEFEYSKVDLLKLKTMQENDFHKIDVDVDYAFINSDQSQNLKHSKDIINKLSPSQEIFRHEDNTDRYFKEEDDEELIIQNEQTDERF